MWALFKVGQIIFLMLFACISESDSKYNFSVGISEICQLKDIVEGKFFRVVETGDKGVITHGQGPVHTVYIEAG